MLSDGSMLPSSNSFISFPHNFYRKQVATGMRKMKMRVTYYLLLIYRGLGKVENCQKVHIKGQFVHFNTTIVDLSLY